MDFELSDEHRALQALCRDLAQEVIAPRAEEWNRAHRFPCEVFRQLGELDLCGPLVPREYGGSGLGMVGYVVAMEQLGQGDQSLAAGWNAHCTIGTLPILDHGTEEQRRRWVEPLARGERLGAFALTEPGSGSDVRSLATRVTYDGDEVILNGRKTFISNAGTEISYGVVTLGKDPEGNFVAVIVPKGTPGYTQGKPYDKVGWHALDTREQIFEEVRLPRDHVLGDGRSGLRAFLASLDAGRISVAALAVSLAQAALHEATAYAQQRRAFGQPISKFQAIQFKLARMAAAVEAARLLTYQAAWLYDQGRPYTKQAAIAKLVASEAATAVVSEAVQIHGGYGWVLDSRVARLYLDAKILEIGEGTNEIQQLVIARQLGC
ncbi:MAG TPA: acyl-CoA dehydrogenase family protein [Candidatus Dormibacteraeota bacterium]|nr:acyl-CoA dehydrogenase family protein [Candidatus Dormibacteraeota bacterium]